MVKELTAPKVSAIPLTLKYAAHPAMNRAAPPINNVNTFIHGHLCRKKEAGKQELVPKPKSYSRRNLFRFHLSENTFLFETDGFTEYLYDI